jgi:hypothetical protein
MGSNGFQSSGDKMSQYSSQQAVPALLKDRRNTPKARTLNGMVELEIDNNLIYVPSAETFQRLLKRVHQLEQRLYTAENRANKKVRKNNV